MATIYNFAQHSPEWHAIRVRPTASNFSRLVTPAGKPASTASDYAAEILAAHYGIRKPWFETPAMATGTRLEPESRAMYELLTDNEVTQVGFVTYSDDPFAPGCSPDGLICEDGCLEIKCPEPWTHLATLMSGVMPDKHKPQVQGNLFVTGRQWLDFVSYCPGYDIDGEFFALPVDKQMFITRVYRDEKYIAALEAATAMVQELLIKHTGVKNENRT